MYLGFAFLSFAKSEKTFRNLHYSHAPEPTNPAQYQGCVLSPAARRLASRFCEALQIESAVVAPWPNRCE